MISFSRHDHFFSRPIYILLGSTVIWLLLHIIFADFFIYHDSWKHLFPVIFSITKQANCGSIPAWLGMIDNGSPTIIYLISKSLTEAFSLPYLILMGCVKPGVLVAMYAYKFQIYLVYLGFSCGMFFMGLTLFQHRISAIYLFAVTLFAGMCLDHAHSSQIGAIVFWAPWIVAGTRLAINSKSINERSFWVNTTILLICAQALDQYPHFVLVSVVVSMAVFLLPNKNIFLDLVRVRMIRLWPAAIAIALTIVQLAVIRSNIVDYQPSLRSGLIVTPEQFGETGFLQPTAFIASFFPLTFLHGFDTFAQAMAPFASKLGAKPGDRWFIFQLDALLMVVGFIPLLLAAFFTFSKAKLKLRIGMASFVLIMLAISLQQTKLYILLFNLPFFNLFRSYFLFTPFAVMGLFVMSAYGLDRLQDADITERSLAGKRASLFVLGLAFFGLAMILMLYKTGDSSPEIARNIRLLLSVDILCSALAFIAFKRAFLANEIRRPIFQMILVTIILQSISSAGLYFIVGENRLSVYEKFGLSPGSNFDHGKSLISDNRLQCTKYPDCYLAPYPTVSLNTDLNGTFLRNSSEPIFFSKQIGLDLVRTLTGLNGSAVWISSSVKQKLRREDVVDALSSDKDNGGNSLPIYVITPHLKQSNQVTDPAAQVEVLHWSGDTIHLKYSSKQPAFIFAQTNWDGYWVAKLGDKLLDILPANLGGSAIAVPAGQGILELKYANTPALFAWISRCLLVLAAAAGTLFIGRHLLRIKA
jgi:hypothetical protein